jgi:hypothetical protein
MLADAGVPVLEVGKELVTKPVAGVGGVLVGGIFAPGLIEAGEVGLDLGTANGEHRAEDAAFWKLNDGMDAGEALGPSAAQEFAEYGFGLIVEGMSRGYGVDLAGCHEFAKPGVAKAAGGFLDCFSRLARFPMQSSFGSGIDLARVKWNAERGCEIGSELLIEIGVLATQAVVEMRGVQDDSQFPGLGCEPTGKSYGIRSAGEADGQAQARLKQRCVERKRGFGNGGWHSMMVNTPGW